MTTETAERTAHPLVVFNEQLKSREPEFKAALPAHIPVERFMRVLLTAVQNNPGLVNVERRSLFNAAMRAAQDGLLPDSREGAIVEYRDKNRGAIAQWMPMIAGIRKKVRNSGEIATWDAHVVHEKDQFEYELGDDPFIKHRPFMDGDPGNVIAAYSVTTLKSGEKSREVMTRSELDKVRNASRAKDRGPWADWFEEMCRKTVARRHSKSLPMSTDLDDLVRRDDDLYDFKETREETKGEARRPKLVEQLDAIAKRPSVDPETGEVSAQALAGEESQAPPEEAPEVERPSPGGDDPRAQLLEWLRHIALNNGPKRLSLALGKLTEQDQALLTEEDRTSLRDAAANGGDA